MDALDLLVVVDPYPTATAAMAAMQTEGKVNPNRAVYLLPASTQFECSGSVTASNRSVQWREKVIDPLFESLPDHVIIASFGPTNWASVMRCPRTTRCLRPSLPV